MTEFWEEAFENYPFQLINCKKKYKKPITMYIKNRRNSSKFKSFGSYQTLLLTKSEMLRNRLLFIY